MATRKCRIMNNGNWMLTCKKKTLSYQPLSTMFGFRLGTRTFFWIENTGLFTVKKETQKRHTKSIKMTVAVHVIEESVDFLFVASINVPLKRQENNWRKCRHSCFNGIYYGTCNARFFRHSFGTFCTLSPALPCQVSLGINFPFDFVAATMIEDG